MAHFDGLNIPTWKRRRWAIFKKMINTPEVSKGIEDYHRENPDALTIPMSAMWAINTNEMPDGCSAAYVALLKNPKITEQELVDLIESPVKIISHVHKSIALNDNPNDAYESYMHKIGADGLLDDVDPLYYDDTALYLRIDPFTKPTVIKDFITKYFDNEMWPLLQTQPGCAIEQSKYIVDRNSKLRDVVCDNAAIIHSILALHSDGNKSRAIADTIQDEYGEIYTQSYIRQIISDNKQR